MLYFIHKHGNILFAGALTALYVLVFNITGLNVFVGALAAVFVGMSIIQYGETFIAYKGLLDNHTTQAQTPEEYAKAERKVAASYVKTAKRRNVPEPIIAHMLNIDFKDGIAAFVNNKNATPENLSLIAAYIINKNWFMKTITEVEANILTSIVSNKNISAEVLDVFAAEAAENLALINLPAAVFVGYADAEELRDSLKVNEQVYKNVLMKIAKNPSTTQATLGYVCANVLDEDIVNASIIGLVKTDAKLEALTKPQIVTIFRSAYIQGAV